MDRDNIASYILIAVVLGALIWLVGILITEDAKARAAWEAFKQAHACKLVAHKDSVSSSNTGFALNGNGDVVPVFTTSTEPSQDAWLCDDGITYWKEAR